MYNFNKPVKTTYRRPKLGEKVLALWGSMSPDGKAFQFTDVALAYYSGDQKQFHEWYAADDDGDRLPNEPDYWTPAETRLTW